MGMQEHCCSSSPCSSCRLPVYHIEEPREQACTSTHMRMHASTHTHTHIACANTHKCKYMRMNACTHAHTQCKTPFGAHTHFWKGAILPRIMRSDTRSSKQALHIRTCTHTPIPTPTHPPSDPPTHTHRLPEASLMVCWEAMLMAEEPSAPVS
eukprot:scaffold66501_cov20-Tisochrysis_lutea.AAC.2